MKMKDCWVTFDCFGTLVDWNTGFSRLLNTVFGPRAAAAMAAYHRHERLIEAEKPHRLYSDVLSLGLERAAKDLGVSLSDSAVRTLVSGWGTLPVFSDTEPMLAELRSQGCHLAVLTNCDDALFEQTHRSFQKRFDLVITAEQVKSYKPALAHFERFAETTGVNRANWAHVACSWFHDIAPARQMNVSRIWLDRDRTGDDPSAASVRVETASQVGGCVRRLLADANSA